MKMLSLNFERGIVTNISFQFVSQPGFYRGETLATVGPPDFPLLRLAVMAGWPMRLSDWGLDQKHHTPSSSRNDKSRYSYWQDKLLAIEETF